MPMIGHGFGPGGSGGASDFLIKKKRRMVINRIIIKRLMPSAMTMFAIVRLIFLTSH